MYAQSQYLRIRTKLSTVPIIDIIVKEYYIWSVAIDPSDTIFYLTINGDLYKMPANATSELESIFLG